MSTGPLYLGLDLGTTNVKAIVVDADGRLLSTGSARVPVHHQGPETVEQDIEEIWASARAAIGQAARGGGVSRIAAIGVSSQGGALQPLDAARRPLGPVISWQDGRGAPWDRALSARHGPRWFERRIGARSSGSCVGQIARLREEGALPGDGCVGFVGDLVVGRLCSLPAHEASSLSVAFLYNPSLGREDPDVLRLLGLSPASLPDLRDAREAAGPLGEKVAKELGLEPGIPVGPAVHDQYAAALGCGVTRPGDVMFGAGTAWVLLAATERLHRPLAGFSLAGRHPVAGVFGLMLSLANGGSALSWAIETLGLRGISPEDLDARLASVAPGCEGLRCRPLLSPIGGAGLPAGTAGRFDGLRIGHSPSHLLRAVVEGLACELGRYLRMMRRSGVRIDRLVMCGRAAASAVTPAIVAGVTGSVVDCAALAETSALGAAVLARGLVEPDVSLDTLTLGMKPPLRRVEPPGTPGLRTLLQEYLAALG